MKNYFVFGLVFSLLVFCGTVADTKYTDDYENITTAYDLHNNMLEKTYNNVWITVKDVAAVPDTYADEFKQQYITLTGTNNDTFLLLEWITAHSQTTTLTQEQYGTLINSIIGNRSIFIYSRNKAYTAYTELQNITTTFPGSWFLSNKTVKKPTFMSNIRVYPNGGKI